MSRDHRVEIELQHLVHRLRPVQEASTLDVVNVDRDAGRPLPGWRSSPAATSQRQEQIAGVDGLHLGEVDDRVAARVAAAEIVSLNLLAAKIDRELVRERDAWQPDRCSRRVLVVRALDIGQVGADVPVRDHLRNRQHLEVAAGVIVVLVSVDDVTQGLVRHRLDLREDVGMVAVEHVVNQDNALGRRVEGHVATLTRDHVQITLHPLRP